MANICCLLDACTVINLIHIDEDDFLIRKIEKVNYMLNSTVFEEVKKNVYKPLDKEEKFKHSDKVAIEEKRKLIDQVLPKFLSRINDNEKLVKDLGYDYFVRISEELRYNKNLNGELCSSAYALYLSRINSEKVFFYTDDYPAKDYFTPFFNHNQIGHIKDSVDFLLLVYWLNDNFSKRELVNMLSKLYSLYATEVTLLKKELEDQYSSKLTGKFFRGNKEIVFKLKELILKLDNLQLQNINELKQYFSNKKSRCFEINEILGRFQIVFDLETKSGKKNILIKIQETMKSLEINEIYKWNDLLLN